LKEPQEEDTIKVSRRHNGKTVEYTLSEKMHDELKKIGIDSYHELGCVLDEVIDDMEDMKQEIPLNE
jgi:hypothetical protein